MSSRLSAALTAALVTLLSASCFGVLLAGFDYFLIEWIEHAAEFIGLLPRGWGESHFSALLIATAATSLPPIVWLSILLFRRSYRIELDQDNAPPPA